MKYCNFYFLKLTFHDGMQDTGYHPYVILLDANSTKNKEVIMLKAKTFDPLRHQKYIDNGQSQIINLKKLSIVNCEKAYKHRDINKSDNPCNFNEFYNVVDAYNQYQIKNNSCQLYKQYKKIIRNHLLNNFK